MIGRLLAQTGHLWTSEAHWVPSEGAGAETTSGVKMDAQTSLTLPAVFRAVDLLASHLAMLPLPVFRRLPDGGRERVRDHRVTGLLNSETNPFTTAFQFKRAFHVHVLLYGNGRAEIKRPDGMTIRQLDLLSPNAVRLVEVKGDPDRYMYEVRDPGTDVPRMLRNRQVISVGNLGMDGMTGHRLIDFLAHNNVGLARSISRYVESFFGNNTAVNVYLSTDDKIRDAETKKKHLQSFRRAFGSSKNAFKPMLLDGGLQVKKLGVDNQAAQTLELLSYSVKDIARWFNVPPHMLAELGDATFSNITEQVLSYVKFSLTPWLIAYEQELSRKLLSPSESRTHFIEFVLEGLLRGAPKERGEFYKTMFSIGAYSINDIRRRENENSIGPAGDAHFVPVNMITAERLVEGGTKQPPQQERPPEPAQPNGNIERASIGVFVDAATRVITREVKAARSASGRYAGDRFESWIGRFFAREPGKIIDAFSPVVLALCEYHGARYDDVGSHLADLADEYAKRAASELSSASNVDALLDVWTVERIPSFATEVLERMAKVIDHEE